jgi:hypothetical protein
MSAIALLTDPHFYYLYRGPAGMRKSIDGLCGVVYNELGRAINHKDALIFLNKHSTHGLIRINVVKLSTDSCVCNSKMPHCFSKQRTFACK